MKTIASAPLPKGVQTPRYDRQQLQTRIVHFGFGAFHRAHQALLTDRVLNAQGGDWGICEISLFSGDRLMSQLREQNHLYTVLEKGANGNQAIIVGAVKECLNAKLDSLAAIIEKFCEPQVAIVSLTITEKGYCIDPATGSLDVSNPRIIHDMQHPTEPHSAPGILVEALHRRRERGLSPFTVLSCDNIPDNGHVVKNAVLGMAEKRAAELAAWIHQHVSFPGTMVDRIVPAATEESLDEITRELGVADPCAISCEPFIQWVIEDNFVAGRPQWEVAGVQMVDDVLPWEQMKLRMLNGSHSFLAYLGYLAGFQHISDCMQDSAFREAAYRLMMNEQAPTLRITNVDLSRYAASLIERFANPALKHRTWQIAMDGSQKLPQRMLEGIREHLARGSDWPLLALGVAGWMRYVSSVDDAGATIDIRDPLSEKIRLLVESSSDAERVSALLSLQEVFGTDLVKNPLFVQTIEQAWRRIAQHGAHQAVIDTLKN
ncbi:TPA: mannitol dehydrogenase family protein [Citrobacter koseri]|uniref:Mannitol dehydrogenase family protein n=1 Tax=Citrobacter koseri TaxID=545 RepID=A0AAQ0V6M4_CITKO|nr:MULTISPECIES: mannitol dehydrogenase family protein [Citrobacter]OFV18432.1 D-mannonate oxidoreductase [Salmonella sp. HMSC13B08]ASE83962.1 mannitol dehydrogenase family protein [Citrobacter koseri]ATF98157.1 mannitol dehydrogenase family protein [Citrobacter koseri]AVE69377.1 mannitol dehydrogenase family protein [Citrobacter koseri]EJK7981765.1 mannitol dehydrogenase family protein [Citrobacter koseri]